MASLPAISASGLTKAYSKTTGLFDFNLDVPAGSVTALLGPNGAGKTTAVRILTTLTKPDGGQASIYGYDVVHEPQKVQSIIGVTGQSASIDEKLTGTDNLVMFGQLHRLSTKDARNRAAQLIRQFGLSEAANKPLKVYSGGMKRKLDLAVSLIVAPPILFLDEPTTGLDPISRSAIWDSIRELVQRGTTVLLTTQYLDEADQLADAIVFIDDGHVVAKGAPAQLKAQLGATRFVVTTATEGDFRKLASLLPKQVLATEPKTHTVSFAAISTSLDGLRSLAALIERITAARIAITSYRVQQPSLDDVFMRLTSRDNKESK
jgi:ABC-2 type transport system ATP-binding protein